MPSHAMPSDATLLASLGSGAEDAMSDLYDRYQARVYGAALGVCGDEASAADTCLQTFLWVRGQATRLSRCPQEVIERAIDLQTVAFGRQRAGGSQRAGFERRPSVTPLGEEGMRPPSP